ncbi:uncharacterized protein LOC129786350 [Lutzomyia longipalpis]|uniref:uncharacterized protein LOC129786350 n=1 Tax=Lutzomyia longipalpis TaxID=7200 RepID=UPI002483D00D|nr:uncharacterized protein LOC129786350 [Lutzomyia longipalpis]
MVQKGGNNILNAIKGIYYNEFHWAIVKSYALFLVGVRIAHEVQGLEIMPSLPK